MAIVKFTNNLRRHIDCPDLEVAGETLNEVLTNAFKINEPLRHYILDDQDRLRKHITIAIDGTTISDRIHLTDAVSADSEVFVLQALSGG